MEIMELSEQDMQNTGGGGRSWDDEKLQEDIKNAYQQVAGEEGGNAYIGITLEDMAEYYDGTLDDLKDLDYTNPNVARKILNNLEDAGFHKESGFEKRKYAVGTRTENDGSVIFKVELRPKE
jgi:hypothetical protein